jgi:hypothetical protein
MLLELQGTHYNVSVEGSGTLFEDSTWEAEFIETKASQDARKAEHPAVQEIYRGSWNNLSSRRIEFVTSFADGRLVMEATGPGTFVVVPGSNSTRLTLTSIVTPAKHAELVETINADRPDTRVDKPTDDIVEFVKRLEDRS